MVIELINNIIYVLQFIIVASLCFRMNHRITLKRLVVIGITVIVIEMLLYHIKDVTIRMFIAYLYMFGIMWVLYTERKLVLLMYTLVMTAGLSLLNLMPKMMVACIASMINAETKDAGVYSTYSLLISTVFLSGIGLVTYHNSKKGLKSLGWKYMIIFSVLLIADSVVVLALGDFALSTFEKNIIYKIMYVLVVIGIFIQLAMVIWFMLSREVYREKEIITKKYLENQVEYYSYLENRERETKKFRHDIRNHISMLSRLYEQQDYEMFNSYMKDIQGKIQEFGNQISVDNGIADAIFNKYYDESEKKGIHLKVEGHFPKRCSISAYDLCTILSNLLSNAICAEENCGGKEILVRCRYTDTEIILDVENDYNTVIKNDDGKLVTSKKDVFNHGFGLENVAECVERNQGLMDIQVENNRFRVLLSLKNQTLE